MIHLSDLIQDLGFILITAGAVTLLFKKLGQPVVLGYMLAGILLGPSIPFLPTVKDTNSIQIWAEIGVIFLLFGLGLEFSFKKLTKVGRAASITALFEIGFMLGLGFLTGQILGWNRIDSLFLGGILSISSTTIIVRAFDELGLKGKRFVSLVFGVLIVEDIVAILLLVLLSTVAISQSLSGLELAVSGVRLSFFLILWFVVGIYILPPFLNRVRHLLNDETTLITALALCLLMVMVATKVGFSPALGAFVMGSLLAETREGARIEKLIHPVRDLFAAIFFVSVGMLINPKILFDFGPEILLIIFVTILGKLLSSSLGALLSGASLRHSIQAGLSLAQIGEFSFIIATLGLTLKVTSDFLYPVAVSVSALTTLTTPYLIRSAEGAFHWLQRRIPASTLERLERYQMAVQSEGTRSGILSLLWQGFGWRILLNSIVVIAVFLFGAGLILPALEAMLKNRFLCSVLVALFSSTLAVPFLWAIAFGSPALRLSPEDRKRINHLTIGIFIARVSIASFLAGIVINVLLPLDTLSGLIAFLFLVALVLAGRFSEAIYARIERRFIKNLESDSEAHGLKSNQIPSLAPWDVGLTDFVINPNSNYVGLSLQQSKLKEAHGVTVALVERGDERILAPDRHWILMPHDRLFIIGTDEQLEEVKAELERPRPQEKAGHSPQSFGLRSLKLTADGPFTGKILRESGLREAISGLVVGIERAGRRILSPDSSMALQADDLLWIVGDLEKIKQL